MTSLLSYRALFADPGPCMRFCHVRPWIAMRTPFVTVAQPPLSCECEQLIQLQLCNTTRLSLQHTCASIPLFLMPLICQQVKALFIPAW